MSDDPASPDDRSQAAGGWQYPPGYGQQTPPDRDTGPAGSPQAQAVGFSTALFDFGFHSVGTPSVVKILYILGTVLTGIVYLFVLANAFAVGVVNGLLFVVVGGLFALFSLTLLRITLEFFHAVVRMSEDIHHRR